MTAPGAPTSSTSEAPPRISTGVPGLDLVLGGGLPRGRTTLVAGTSGSGKTVLGLQFLWAGGQGEPGVLVTFEERANDLLANVRGFGWQPADWWCDARLAVVDATVEEDVVEIGRYDFGGLLARIENAVRTTGARRLVIDAIDAAFAQFSDAGAVRRELARVVRLLRQLEVTTLITAERPHEYGSIARHGVEEFLVDNVVLLRNVLERNSRRRTVEVLKLRGFGHNKGEYPFVIDPARGITILPLSTIESPGGAPTDVMSMGNPDLDAMCRGGVYRDSLVLVAGATGTGKSLMGAQFLAAGLRAGERVVLFSFEENPGQIIRNAASWGIDLDLPSREGTLEIISRFSERMGLEDLLVAIQSDVERHGPRRVVIDSLTALEHNTPRQALRHWMVGLATILKTRRIGAMITTTSAEVMSLRTVSGAELSTLSDAIFMLRYVEINGELRRAVVVLKTRGSGHDQSLREFEIHGGGMRILEPIRGVHGILDGASQPDWEARGGSGER
jgi:circadian clock protein KaiC